MLEVMVMDIENDIVYIKLLDEGTIVYRPVPAFRIDSNIYQINGNEFYNPDDENWEFIPGTIVNVEPKILSGTSTSPVLVGISRKE
jgi:hypothetical protein